MSLDDRMRNLFPFHSFSAQKAPAPLRGRGLRNAIKLSGRTFLAPHRGSSPKGLCKRTGFLGVKRHENPVRRHFERSEMRGLRSGIACKCWNIDSVGLFNMVRYTASMPLLPSALPPKGDTRCLRDDEKRRILLAPHRGSSPKGLCKRTGFLGVKRRENPVRRHFERSEMRGLRSGIACKCWNIDSIGLFNIARYTASMPLLPSALPPKGEARRYVANDFLNLTALLCGRGLSLTS